MKSLKPFLTTALIALAAFAWLATSVRAAVPIGTIQTFDAVPVVGDWSTVSIGTAGNNFNDFAALDAAVQTNTAAMISTALPTSATVPPSTFASARWNSTGHYLQTRPTGNGAALLMATLINNTASALNSLDVSYDMTTFNQLSEAALPAHEVYYSMTGTEGSWVRIAPLSEDNVAGAKGTTIDLSGSPLGAGGTMYLLFVDDNADGPTDPSYTIDNFLAQASGQSPVFVVHPASTTVTQCHTATFSVQVSGSPPLTLHWFHNSVQIDPLVNPSASTSTLTISNAQSSDAGSYFCRAQNNFGTRDSNPATLTVLADNTPPTMVNALGLADLVTIVITFSEPMNPATAPDNLNYAICNKNNPNDCLAVLPGTLSADHMQVTFVTTAPRTLGVSYEVEVFGLSDECNNNFMPDGTKIALNTEVVLLTADDVTMWRYNQEGVDLSATAWKDPSFVEDGTWGTGAAALAVEDTPPADPALRTTLVRNNANFPVLPGTTAPTNDIPTYYFRAHFNFPGDPTAPSARLQLRVAFDDFGYVYINGVEVYRDAFLGTVGGAELPFASYTGGTAIGNYGWGPLVNISLASVVQGDNVVAVQMKQQATTSSDIGMALELLAQIPQLVEQCPSITGQPQSITVDEFAPATFSVSASGTSLQYEWQKNGVVIPGANQRTYTIASAQTSDAPGPYRVRVFNTCSGANSVLSAPATLTIIPKTTKPRVVSAVGEPGQTTILITFANGPISAATAQSTANYTIPGITVQGAALQPNGLDVLLTTTARTPGTSYSLTVRNIRDTSGAGNPPGNLLDPNPTVINPLLQRVQVLVKDTTWKYLNDGSNLDAVPWTTAAYSDLAWLSAQALLGFETTAGTFTALASQGWNTNNLMLLSRTNTTGGGLNGTNITDYFRTTVNLPFSLAGAVIEIHHAIDDGAVFYFNGTEAGRYNMPTGAVGYLTPASSAPAEGVTRTLSGLTGLVTGNNVIAVSVHQGGTPAHNSSDIVFGAEMFAIYGATPPTLHIVNNGNGTVTLSWTPAGGTLQQSSDLVTWTNRANTGNPQTFAPTGVLFFRIAP